MKNIFYIILIALACTSCSKDDSNENSGTIIGKWNYNQVSATINGELLVGDYPGNAEGCPKDFLDFKENGIISLTDYEKVSNLCQIELVDGTYAVSGNSVSVSIDGANFSGQITQLTSTDMVVMGSLGDLQNVTFSFKKQ